MQNSLLYPVLYLQTDAVFLILVLFVFFKSVSAVGMRLRRLRFSQVLISIAILVFLDGMWMACESGLTPNLPVMNTIISAVYMFQTGVVGFLWILYTESVYDGNRIEKSVALRLTLSIPLAILFLFSACSPWTEWLYYIDAQNVYHRGPYHFVQVIVAGGYLLFAFCRALVLAYRTKNSSRRSEYITLSLFVIFPIIGSAMQLIVGGLPSISAGCIIAMFIVYTNLQEQRISTDALTGMNNHRTFDLQLQHRISSAARTQSLFLIMLDVNSFKKINDTYGHYEGDRALEHIAEILKRVCSENNLFSARYGGDEFAILCESDNSLFPQEICKKIDGEFEDFNAQGKQPYILSICSGYSRFLDGTTDTAAKLIARADGKLYENKERFYLKKNI